MNSILYGQDIPVIKHIFRIMKMTLISLFTCICTLFATEADSQNARVSIHANGFTIQKVINEIEKQTDYLFVYDKNEVNINRKVNVNAQDESVSDVLHKIFVDTNVGYKVLGKNITLITRQESSSKSTSQTQQNQKRITGTVLDSYGQPIIGANVVEKGTTNGIITDVDGKFSLEVGDKSIIQVSFIGFNTQEIPVSGSNNFTIKLSENTQALDEVVVVGYGVVRKADLAGSVSVLDNKSFKDQPITQVSDALQGRVSGVQVTSSGLPGGTVKIRVRGAGSINRSNDPLYIVDGIVRESGLNGINPEDIQSMQILKDASSTAIYGSRGSNGVVMITTKTGKVNSQQLTVDAQLGFGNVAKRMDLMNAHEFATAYNEAYPNTFNDTQMTAFQNGTAGTDFQDEMYRTALTQNYKVAFSKGNEDTQYYLSLNYMDQQGVIIETDNKRYQFRTNITSDITSWLHLNADVSASHNTNKGGSFSATKGNVMWAIMNFAPVNEIQKADGSYTRDSYCGLLTDNPVGMMKRNQSDNMSNILNGRLDLKFTILPTLTFTTTNGVDYNDSKYYSFSSKQVGTSNGMSNSDQYRMTLQSTNNLTYMNKWGAHSLTATGVFEATSSQYRSMSISGSGLKTESVGYWNVNMASSRTENNSYEKWTLLSGVARLMYNYGDRYMATATFRADGSSKFFKDKWGYFPSLALAWMVGNESFMKNQNWIQNLKIRASYGLVGSQAISPYGTLGLMSQTLYSFGGGTNYTGYWTGTSIATPDLSWEKTHQLDLGLEFGILQNRLRFNIDYFDKRTTDGLLQKSIPNYDGGGSYWVNAGKINNKGVDLTVDADIINGKDFSWTTTINGTYLKNKVKSLDDIPFIAGATPASGMIPSDGVTRVAVGQPIGSFYGYVWTGLDETGHDTYADLDGSGTVSSGDRTFIGKANPDFSLGWNNSVRYKNWELNAFFTGSFGADRLNLMRFTGASMNGDSKFITLREAYYDSFAKKGASARYPSVNVTNNDYEAASTKWLENADYFRLDNLSLSYNLSKGITKFADLRFTFSCQNLFTITKYKGQDPAGVSFMSSESVDINDGIDIGAYPTARTFTWGVRMNF